MTRVEAGERDRLIANQFRAALDGTQIPALGLEVGFGARHKETPRLAQPMQSPEIDVTTVQDVRGGRIGQHQVEDIHILQRKQLDRRLGRTKRSLRKCRQAQVDGAGVPRVARFLKVDAKRFPGIKTAGDADERLGNVGRDCQIAHAGLNFAQALPVGELHEGHAQILIEAGKGLDLVLTITRNASAKRRQWQMLCEMREHEFALVHRYPYDQVPKRIAYRCNVAQIETRDNHDLPIAERLPSRFWTFNVRIMGISTCFPRKIIFQR